MTEESTINEKGEETIWGFKEKDIITTSNKESAWYNKKVVIDLVQCLGIYVKELDNDKLHLHNFDPKGIILLERPEYKFKVGDKVGHTKIKDLKCEIGEIIAINPNNCKHPFFVEFAKLKEAFPTLNYNKPWFPRKHLPTFRIWCNENELEPLS